MNDLISRQAAIEAYLETVEPIAVQEWDGEISACARDRDFTPWGEDYEPLLSEEEQAVDKAVETLEKQIPKKPRKGVCPNCGSRHIYAATLMKAECFKFCGDCGQALDWEE